MIIHAIEAALQEFSRFQLLRTELSADVFCPNVKILAVGKSAYYMAKAAAEALTAAKITYEGYLLTSYSAAKAMLPCLTTYEAGHPLPDENSLQNSRKILAWLQSLDPDDSLIILLSGGGSALFEIPVEGFGLADLIALNQQLLRSGKSIAEMNSVRCQFSQLKGGKALSQVSCKNVFCYALSDVADNKPEVIASGAFFNSSFQATSPESYEYWEGAKNKHYRYRIIGDNLSFCNTLAQILPQPGTVHKSYLAGSARQVASFLADFALNPLNKGIHLWGGEAPVKVNASGKGGRCTHLALDIAIRISGIKGLSFTAYASDGNDNLPGIAGAMVNGESVSLMQEQGIKASLYLQNCDSYSALKAINALLPGSVYATNVNDLYVIDRKGQV